MSNGSQKRGLEALREFGALVLRLALAAIFIYAGGYKVGLFGGQPIAQTIEYFGSMGIPPVLGYLAILAELGGGIGLVLGFLTRLCGLGIVVVMIVAIAMVHWQHGFSLKDNGFEYNLALAAMGLYFVCAGGGPVSLDNAIWGKRKKG